MKWIFLFLLISCSDINEGYRNEPSLEQEETSDSFAFNSFSTRLTNNFLVSGKRCFGNETAGSNAQVLVCEAGQWLVVIDDVNFCTPQGCTEVVVPPVVASLILEAGADNINFFSILPEMTVNENTESKMDDVLLRVDNGLNPQVVFRQPI